MHNFKQQIIKNRPYVQSDVGNGHYEDHELHESYVREKLKSKHMLIIKSPLEYNKY